MELLSNDLLQEQLDTNRNPLLDTNEEDGVNNPSSNGSTTRKISIDQAKRLLALASIRPSKTFHKSMTDEEIEILKKYYELIKPKVSVSNQGANSDPDRERYENSPPVVYNTARVNSLTLVNLKNFLDQYKKDLDSGTFSLEFDQTSEESVKQGTNGHFVLKNASSNSIIRFPDDLNDALVAFAITTADKESRTLGEANLFRIVNWNDASVRPSGNSKTTTNQRKQEATGTIEDCLTTSNVLHNIFQPTTQLPSNSTSPNSSTLSFEYIKNLSNLISSILEPKLAKQLSYTGVDIG